MSRIEKYSCVKMNTLVFTFSFTHVCSRVLPISRFMLCVSINFTLFWFRIAPTLILVSRIMSFSRFHIARFCTGLRKSRHASSRFASTHSACLYIYIYLPACSRLFANCCILCLTSCCSLSASAFACVSGMQVEEWELSNYVRKYSPMRFLHSVSARVLFSLFSPPPKKKNKSGSGFATLAVFVPRMPN